MVKLFNLNVINEGLEWRPLALWICYFADEALSVIVDVNSHIIPAHSQYSS